MDGMIVYGSGTPLEGYYPTPPSPERGEHWCIPHLLLPDGTQDTTEEFLVMLQCVVQVADICGRTVLTAKEQNTEDLQRVLARIRSVMENQVIVVRSLEPQEK